MTAKTDILVQESCTAEQVEKYVPISPNVIGSDGNAAVFYLGAPL